MEETKTCYFCGQSTRSTFCSFRCMLFYGAENFVIIGVILFYFGFYLEIFHGIMPELALLIVVLGLLIYIGGVRLMNKKVDILYPLRIRTMVIFSSIMTILLGIVFIFLASIPFDSIRDLSKYIDLRFFFLLGMLVGLMMLLTALFFSDRHKIKGPVYWETDDLDSEEIGNEN